jgi:hypothetical protein
MNDEIIDVSEESLPVPALGDETLIRLAEQAERRIDAMTKIKKVSLKLTNRHDWVDQNGKPYLQVSGSEKIGRMFGVSWRISEPEFAQEDGGHFSFTYKGYFTLAGATIEAIGTRSSKDGFFKRFDYKNGSKTELPASEIDKGDVKKAAFTNCVGNGITRILGIRNMTYEDLEEFAGITKDMISQVKYKDKGKEKKEIKTEGAEVVTVIVLDVRKKSGTKDGKQWTKFTVNCDDGKEYNTFSETVATTAKEAKENNLKLQITYKSGQYGNDIESVLKEGA